jgi:hypothetical protein
MDREVTLMLALASTGIVVPYERIAGRHEHPSGDRELFAVKAQGIVKTLDQPFASTPLGEGPAGEWLYGRAMSLRGKPDDWDGFRASKPAGRKLARTVLQTIRNALAHGNLWTLDNPIRELVFARERRDEAGELLGYEFIRGSPQAFRALLIAWFDLLIGEGLTPEEASAALVAVEMDDAA